VREVASHLVEQLETLLKKKLQELAERRRELAADGRLDKPARLKLVAERLAVESVLLRKMWDAARCYSQNKAIVLNSEVRSVKVDG